MKLKGLLFAGVILISMTEVTYASDCEPNNMGGQVCVNDDGTTSDSIPNEINGWIPIPAMDNGQVRHRMVLARMKPLMAQHCHPRMRQSAPHPGNQIAR
jgi:hypothetical protein